MGLSRPAERKGTVRNNGGQVGERVGGERTEWMGPNHGEPKS